MDQEGLIALHNEITFIKGNEALLGDVRELWEELNRLHLDKSVKFKQYYRDFTFQSRKESLIKYIEKGSLFIIIAYHDNIKIGFCIAGVIDNEGELESIYIKSDYRRDHIGDVLMRESLDWIKSFGVEKTVIKVSAGNEEAFGFYAKYGFTPWNTELRPV